MAIRYSADVEVRVRWDPRRRAYVGTVRGLGRSTRGSRERWEEIRWRGSVPGSAPRTDGLSEAYDDAGRRLIEAAASWARGRGWALEAERSPLGRVVVERVFKAPCSVATTRVSGDHVARRGGRRAGRRR